MNLFEDYYNILGLTLRANNKEIDAAYKKLILEYYSDNGNENNKLLLINKAYQILKDPNQRNNYNCEYFNFYNNGTSIQPNTNINTSQSKPSNKKPFNVILILILIIIGGFITINFISNQRLKAHVALEEKNRVITYYNEIRRDTSDLGDKIRVLESEINNKRRFLRVNEYYDFYSKEEELEEMKEIYEDLKNEIKYYRDIVKSYEE